MLSHFCAIVLFATLAASATTSPTGGVCRINEDCQTAFQAGETLYCKGEAVLWTYNLDNENLPSEFIPQTGCNLILQKRKPTVSDRDHEANGMKPHILTSFPT